MITFKPLPCERPVKNRTRTGFTLQPISKTTLDEEQMIWVAGKVSEMLYTKKGDLTRDEINTAIEYTRFLLSKMQLLKVKNLKKLALQIVTKTRKKNNSSRKKVARK